MPELRQAARLAARYPRFTVIVALLLALGIGISTALFAVVDAVLLQPLPVEGQNRLVVVWKGSPQDSAHVSELSYPEFEDWRRNSKAMAALAAMPTTLYGYELSLTGYGDPIELERTPVSPGFFSVLGARPALGRAFEETDDHPGAAPAVVLANSTWRNVFHADGSLVGRIIRLGGVGYTVIGVMPPAFDFPAGVALWTPLGLEPGWRRRNASFLQVVARLRPGVSIEQAKSDLAAAIAQVAREYPRFAQPGEFPVVTPLADYVFGVGRPAILLLWAASLLLLAMACMNIGSLLLARAVSRQREVALRLALGATRLRLFRQFVAEALLMSLAGVAAGFAMARLWISLVIALAPPGIPRLASVHLDLRALAFASLAGAAIAAGCGFAPALLTVPRDLRDALDEAGARAPGSRRRARLRRTLLAGEAAVTTLLLAATGMVVHNYRNLARVPIGLAPENVLTAEIKLPHADAAVRSALFTELLARLQAHPEVIAAGAVLLRPFEGAIGWDTPYQAETQPAENVREHPAANLEVVTPDYFRAVGTPLLAGRYFTGDDRDGGRSVAIVSQSLAQSAFGSAARATGRRIRLGAADTPATGNDWLTVVGIVADAQYRTFGVTQGDLFLPYLQTRIPLRYLVIRTRNRPSSFLPALRRDVAAIDPEVAVAKVRTLSGSIADASGRQRFVMLLFLLFAAFAGLLAAVGAYGMVADSLAERRREIGIRIALGAVRGNLLLSLARGELRSVVAGEAIGVSLSIAVARVYGHFLYGLRGVDGVSIVAAALLLIASSVAAGMLPALRATRVPVARLLMDWAKR